MNDLLTAVLSLLEYEYLRLATSKHVGKILQSPRPDMYIFDRPVNKVLDFYLKLH